jgi:hypothetical protein
MRQKGPDGQGLLALDNLVGLKVGRATSFRMTTLGGIR